MRFIYMLFPVKQILVDLDEEMAQRLERVAPARSRQRSDFIRSAIAKALSEVEEERTAAAYRRTPDAGDEAYVDPRVWEPSAPYRKKARRRR